MRMSINLNERQVYKMSKRVMNGKKVGGFCLTTVNVPRQSQTGNRYWIKPDRVAT
jgi:hypothetical protein